MQPYYFLIKLVKKEPTLAGLIFGAQNGEKNPRQNVTNMATTIADFQQVPQLSQRDRATP